MLGVVRHRMKQGHQKSDKCLHRVLSLVLLLWMSSSAFATTYYIAKTGSDANPGTTGSPWLTFDKCHDTAVGGDICLVRSSQTYVAQSITGDSSRSAALSTTPDDANDVIIRPESGAGTVKVADISISGSADHLIIEDIDVGSAVAGNGVSINKAFCIHFRGSSSRKLSMHGVLFIGNAGDTTSAGRPTNLSFQWMDINNAAEGVRYPFAVQLWIGMNHVLIEDSIIQGNRADTSAAHPDGLKVFASDDGAIIDDVIIRRTIFKNNEGINYRCNGLEDVTVENSFFGPICTSTTSACTLTPLFSALDGDYVAQICGQNNVIKYNTFVGALQNESGANGGGTGRTFMGNIVSGLFEGGCPSGVTSTYNVWSTSNTVGCGSNNVRTTVADNWFTSVLPQSSDLHLTANATAALDAGNPASFPTTDIDGATRANPPDAGADEVGSAPATTYPRTHGGGRTLGGGHSVN
jgi:hypothetical protein